APGATQRKSKRPNSAGKTYAIVLSVDFTLQRPFVSSSCPLRDMSILQQTMKGLCFDYLTAGLRTRIAKDIIRACPVAVHIRPTVSSYPLPCGYTRQSRD